MTTTDERSVLSDILAVLADIIQDWDLDFDGGLSGDTRLVADLGFESIDFVMLIEEIQRHFGRTDMPFEELVIKDGSYVDDVPVATIAQFVHRQLTELAPTASR